MCKHEQPTTRLLCLGQVWFLLPVAHLLALLPEDATSSAAPPPLMLPALGRNEKLMALRRSRRLLCSEARRCVGASACTSCCPGSFLPLTDAGGSAAACAAAVDCKGRHSGRLGCRAVCCRALRLLLQPVADAAASAAAVAAAFAAAAASLACCANAVVMSQNSGLHWECKADVRLGTCRTAAISSNECQQEACMALQRSSLAPFMPVATAWQHRPMIVLVE